MYVKFTEKVGMPKNGIENLSKWADDSKLRFDSQQKNKEPFERAGIMQISHFLFSS